MNSVPEGSTMTAPSSPPPALPCDVANGGGAQTVDFTALVGFAARLGTCVNNDDTADGQDEKSVRDEAMLLMSLLMGDKAEEILSDVKKSRCDKRRRRGWIDRSEDCHDMGNFSFTFPSLSLQPARHADATASGFAAEAAGCARNGEDGAEDRPCPSPSQLLGRVQSVHDKELIRDSGEAMAHNLLESFGAALVWRAKTWIKSLANVLALKEQKRIDALKAASGEGGVEAGSDQDLEDVEGGDKGDENDDLMNSKEMYIIDAIVKSSEEVSVVNIKTAFRVLSSRVSHLDGDAAPLSITDPQEPASKKAREEQSPQDVAEYKLTHDLMFEATISMTSNDGVRYNGVKLQAPGYIQGTFANKAGSSTEGGQTLTGVSMTLDTDALALSLEIQSRLVVRRAAEAALMSSRCADCGPSLNKYMESPPRAHPSAIPPRYVLMSPAPECSSGSLAELPPIPTENELIGEELSELNEEEESEKVPVVSDEDTSPNTTPSLTPSEQANFLPALVSAANEEKIRGD
ncbi:hypothetical protein ACHAW5_002414 [Stephanodiscus triporus]|uniref:Uncharacterized protein n=1 Tax=Stephanodiscus triporus TaxID=2934178 RepID=A0ABD3P029_9STRA